MSQEEVIKAAGQRIARRASQVEQTRRIQEINDAAAAASKAQQESVDLANKLEDAEQARRALEDIHTQARQDLIKLKVCLTRLM